MKRWVLGAALPPLWIITLPRDSALGDETTMNTAAPREFAGYEEMRSAVAVAHI